MQPLPDLTATALILLGLLTLTGCVASENTDEKAQKCQELAAGVSQVNLSGQPTRQQTQHLATRLDTQLTQLRDPRIHDAAVSLHFHLHVLDTALGRNDTKRAQTALGDARTDAGNLAKACALPPGDFGLTP